MTAFRRLAGVVVGQIASPPPSPARLGQFDLLLTSFPHFVQRFRALGIDSEYFRIGFDPRVAARLDLEVRTEPSYGAVFVGALNRRHHRRANALLAKAARRTPIDFWGYGLRGWLPWSPIRRRHHGEAWGLEMYRVLRDARISLNRHIGIAGDYANNMRLYEATGVGSLLLTDEKVNLGDLFERGTRLSPMRPRTSWRKGSSITSATRRSGARSRSRGSSGRCATTATTRGCTSWPPSSSHGSDGCRPPARMAMRKLAPVRSLLRKLRASGHPARVRVPLRGVSAPQRAQARASGHAWSPASRPLCPRGWGGHRGRHEFLSRPGLPGDHVRRTATERCPARAAFSGSHGPAPRPRRSG